MSEEENWVRLKLSYEEYLVAPAQYANQLLEILRNARVIRGKDYGAEKSPVMQDSVPGIDFVTAGYVAGAAARAKMLAEKPE